jgi:hypothetical protein
MPPPLAHVAATLHVTKAMLLHMSVDIFNHSYSFIAFVKDVEGIQSLLCALIISPGAL